MAKESTKRIEPRVLKGFRDYLPQATIPRLAMIRTLEQVFSSFGYAPIDTPALEYAEILLGNGGQETDKQLYRFMDQGDREVALRFDLTVPLARFSAMYVQELGTPFRRFHIAPVWRAEKPQRGRYREFIQCDFDIIGVTSPLSDAEVISVAHRALTGIGLAHRFRLNNRKVLNGLLAQVGAGGTGGPVLRAIDKLEKLGREVVTAELRDQAGLSESQVARVFDFLALSREVRSNGDLLAELTAFFAGNELALKGVADLDLVLQTLAGCGITEDAIAIDLSIARGLDYYTGSVFETTLLDLPDIGSICSGGRYDNLASLYTSRELPGVGGSIGLDRIMGALEELGRLGTKSSTADVLVTVLDESSAGRSMALAASLRKEGIPTECYPEAAKLGNQLKYGGKKGLRYAIIAGAEELGRGVCNLKDLSSGEQEDGVSLNELAAKLKQKLG